MRIVDRLLLILYALVVFLTSIFAILYGIGLDLVTRILATLEASPVLIVVGVVMAVISIRFTILRTSLPEPQGYVRATENGEIRISYETLESMAAKAANEHRGVVDLVAKVASVADGIQVGLRFYVTPGTDISALTSEMQGTVKTKIETLTGIPVHHVVVHVKDLSDAAVRQTRPRLQ